MKAEVSIPVGLATVAMSYGVFQMSLPNIADVRSAPAGDSQIAGAERSATWIAAGLVAGVSLIAKDPTVFAVGGAAVIAFSWHYRHANQVNPATGKASAAQNAIATGATLPGGSDYASSPADDYDDGQSPMYQVEGY
jgi:hypothetical protein